ncbi:MAG: phospholipase [Pseudomonadota bacterium]
MDAADRAALDAAITDFEPLFTAQEAFVALERAVLAASESFVAGFRVFDPQTTLRSAEARALGNTWFDLILAKLNAGVRFEITLTDFDPVIATDDHRRSWSAARQFAALNELSTGARCDCRVALHPARAGIVPRLVLHGKTSQELSDKDTDALTPGLAEAKAAAVAPLVPATHHQKLAVIDDQLLYIGGLDLNDRRYDTRDHARPAQETWYDIQALVKGPVVAAASAHLHSFRAACAGTEAPNPATPGFLRTLSVGRQLPVAHISPKPRVTELEDAHMSAIRRARGLIYFETQFFRHMPLAEAIAEAALANPALACVLVLPAAPEDVAFEGNRREDAQLGAQKQADALGLLSEALQDRLALVSPARPCAAPTRPVGGDMATLHGAPIIYVHAKLSLFGEAEAIVSSANLNGRSLRWDTEAGVHLVRPAFVRQLWQRALTHWMGDLAPDPTGDARAFVTDIRTAAARNAATPPADRRHLLLPYPMDRPRALASPLPMVPDEMV